MKASLPFQGNLIGYAVWLVDKIPDRWYSHTVAFLAGLVTALAICLGLVLFG